MRAPRGIRKYYRQRQAAPVLWRSAIARRRRPCSPQHAFLTKGIALHHEILSVGNRSDHTLSNYERIERRFVAWLGGEPETAALNVANARGYLAWLRSDGKAPKTIYLHASVLKCWARVLSGEGYFAEDPLRGLPLPKVPKRLPIVFSPEQFLALLERANGSRIHLTRLRNVAILCLLHDTGVRVTELCDLHRGQVDMVRCFARVIGKGDKERIVHFSVLTRDVLQLYLDERGDPAGWLFRRHDGVRLTRHAVYRQMRRLGIAAGLDELVRCSPHTGRATFATEFAKLHPGEIRPLQTALGHASIGQTMEYIAFAQMLARLPGPTVVESMLKATGTVGSLGVDWPARRVEVPS